MAKRVGQKNKMTSIDELLCVPSVAGCEEIEVAKIRPFKDHPYKVLDDETMHELGIVTYVADAMEKIAEERHIPEIGAVVLEIGEVSGIVPEYLVDCWNYFRVRYKALKTAELQYEMLPAVTYCESCKEEYETVKYGKICPYCGSEYTFLLRGQECNIKELVVEVEDDTDGESADY